MVILREENGGERRRRGIRELGLESVERKGGEGEWVTWVRDGEGESGRLAEGFGVGKVGGG